MLLLVILIVLSCNSARCNFVCLPYLADAFAHWRQCEDACCSGVCDSIQTSYRACGKSQLEGHCNVDSDCEDNAYCSNEGHIFKEGIGGLDAGGYCRTGKKLVTPANWQEKFIINDQQGCSSKISDDSPNSILEIVGYGCRNFVYMNSSIQNSQSFELSFDIKMEDVRGNYFGIFFGYDRIDGFSTIDYNYYLSDGFNIDFNFYQGSGGWWEPGGLAGIKLIRSGHHLAQYSLPQFTGTFTNVKLKYTQSTTSTLMLYYGNSLVFSYDDPNIAEWVYLNSVKGKYWGFQAIQGGATLKAYIKSMLLTYQEFEPTATPTTIRFTDMPTPLPVAFDISLWYVGGFSQSCESVCSGKGGVNEAQESTLDSQGKIDSVVAKAGYYCLKYFQLTNGEPPILETYGGRGCWYLSPGTPLSPTWSTWQSAAWNNRICACGLTTLPSPNPTTLPSTLPTLDNAKPITSPTFEPKRKTVKPNKKYPPTHKKNKRKPRRHYVYQTHSPSKRPTTTKRIRQ